MKNLLSAFLTLAFAFLTTITTAASDLTLRYDKPAPDTPEGWERQALPVGNGRMGAMIFGQPARERIQFNDITLWTGDDKVMGAYQAFGDVFINLPGHDENTTNYSRQLDLEQSLHRVSYTHNNTSYQRETFASHPAQVIVMHLTASKPGSYTGSIELTDMHEARISASGKRIYATGTLAGYLQPPRRKNQTPPTAPPPSTNVMDYASQVQVLHEGGTLATNGNKITFAGCDSLTLILGAGTSFINDSAKHFQGDHPLPRVTAQVTDAAARPWNELLTEHQKDFNNLFSRLALDLGTATPERRALTTDQRIETYTRDGNDPGLEAQFFQFGRYLLISCSRDSLPANLQGLWNNSLTPPWNSDYHTNINIQMNYWPAETTNLSECAEPFFNFVRGVAPVYRQQVAATAARAATKPKSETTTELAPIGNKTKPPEETFLTSAGKPVRGWTVRTESNPFGAMGYTWNKTGNAWYAQHFWEHYAFTQDKEFLRTVAYPVMKEVCEFWQDSLKILPDGRLVAPLGWSPEHGPVEDGVTYDQEIIWDLLNNTIEAADTLGTDKSFRDTLSTMRDTLVKPEVGSWGQLKEWMEDRDDPKDTHRHVSQLFALFPGRQISPTKTPALAAATRKTLEGRGDAGTGWSMAWKTAYWARLLDGDHAYKMMRGQLAKPGARAAEQTGTGTETNNAGGTYPNMFDAHPPFQIDGNFGATAAMCEMLVQSQTGEIQLLPALPSAWPKGSIRGLRARGGFVVDLSWENGRLTAATIHSVSGPGGGMIRYGSKVIKLHLKPGESKSLSPTNL